MKPLSLTLIAILIVSIAWAAHGLINVVSDRSRLQKENNTLHQSLESETQSNAEAWKKIQELRATIGALQS